MEIIIKKITIDINTVKANLWPKHELMCLELM